MDEEDDIRQYALDQENRAERIAWALGQEVDTPMDKLMLVLMAAHADKDGGAWPSIAQLAKVACSSQRQVRESLAELAGRKLITEVEPATPRRPTKWKVGN